MKKKLLIIPTLFVMLWMCTAQAQAAAGKNVILILDTSLSMVGYGGKDILGQVKNSINGYVDSLGEGDQVTFMTFDTRIRIFPTVLVKDSNDRDILKKYISMTEATGPWTYTYKMIQAVFQKADEIAASTDKKRQMVIVVMTDGIDDPPPESRQDQLNIAKIGTRYQDKDWWIYFVNFQDLKKGDKAGEKLKQDISGVTDHVTIINNPDPEKAIGQDLNASVKSDETAAGFRYWAFVIAVIVAALIIFIIIMARRAAQLKVAGRLEYWNNDLLNPYIERFDMTQYHAKSIIIGRGVGCLLNIREFEGRKPFAISAIRHGGAVHSVLSYDADLTVEFINREQGAVLEDGDMFKISNFTFKYMK